MENESHLQRDLRRVMNADTAFGPDHCGAIGADNMRVFEELFDSDNRIYSRMSVRNPLVIGRRGSGKSTFLQSKKLNDKAQSHIVVEINSGSLFSAITKRIAHDHDDDYVENIADTWSVVFDLCLLVAVGGEDGAPEALRTLNLVFRSRYQDAYRKRGTATTGRLTHYFDDFSEEMLGRIKSDIRLWTQKSIHQLRDEAIMYLHFVCRRAICLIDSLEEYKISKTMQTEVLAGLFKCVSEYQNNRGSLMHVHLSVPSELYSFFTRFVSRGVMKDFSNATWLYWHASELMSVCAKRMYLFLQTHRLPGWETVSIKQLNDKSECLKFLSGFFPPTIKTSSGCKEEPIAYLLRHTQLLPRHAIAILNQVYQQQFELDRQRTVFFSERAIKDGVEKRIHEVSEDIIVGYREKYPNLQCVLESAIPNLPLHFKSSEVDKQFPMHIRGVLARHPETADYVYDARSLLRTLMDVGVVGRVVDKTNLYVKAEFAYTVWSRDVGFSPEQDSFCFHPVFAKRFRCIYDKTVHKPVYPLGTDPNMVYG